MKIYYDDTELDVQVNDNSYRYRAIKGDHNLTLYFSLPEHIEIPVGAYCVFENETYTLESTENFKMHNSRNFEYTLVMESSQAKLKKYKFRKPIYAWDGSWELKFELTSKPKEHLQMLVDNLNERDSGWTVGECIDATEKLIAYNHTSCDAALSQIAEAFETEWEIVDKTINLRKVEYNKDNPLPLSYGRGKGFKPGVGRTNFNGSRPVEVLFVQGGERNIDPSKYKNTSLGLPIFHSLRYDGRKFSDEDGFNEAASRRYKADGYNSIVRNSAVSNLGVEESLDLSNIYPSRIGEVTKVEITKDGFCDFFDNTIPQALDFSVPEMRFKGETMTIIFQSGELAGKEFEIQQNDERVIGYIHSERRFKVIEQLIDGEPMPKGNYMPAVGDKYAVFGISLPDAYICDNETKSGASWDMFREAVKYFYENEQQKFTFTGELDGIWAKKNWINIGGKIKLGGYVLFSDNQFQPEGIGIRIVGIKDYINNPHSPEIELSNSVVGSSIMSDIRKIESNEVLADSQHKEVLQFTKRRFRDIKETSKLLEGALLNFTDSVNPITVNTMQLLLGDTSLQFRFVNSQTSPVEIGHLEHFDSKNKVFIAEAGMIQHMTLGIDSISISHKDADYKYWSLPAFESAKLTDQEKSYYVYAKCSEQDSSANFILSEKAISLNEEAGYYHLLVGILNSEFEGDRSYAPMYGFTLIEPGRMTVNRISGSNFDLEAFRGMLIDLENNRIVMGEGAEIITRNISIRPPTGEDLDLYEYTKTTSGIIDDTQNTATKALEKALKAETDAANNVADYNEKFASQQAQIDGEISNWFYDYSPTLTNAPANTWLEPAEKDRHIGDTFTNTEEYPAVDAGKSWRWLKNAWDDFLWQPISDSDAVKALQEAAKAQSTADKKSTTFVLAGTETPKSYRYGDMWILQSDMVHSPNKKGEVLFALNNRDNLYVASDWVTMLVYTDDTTAQAAEKIANDAQKRANAIKIGTRNLIPNSNFDNDAYWGYWKSGGDVNISIADNIATVKYSTTVASVFTTGDVVLKPNTNYVLSFYAKADYPFIGFDYNYIISSQGNVRLVAGTPTITTEWRRFSLKIIIRQKDSIFGAVGLGCSTGINSTVMFKEFQLEENSEMSDWRDSFSDVDYLKSAFPKSTVIDAGVVLGDFLGVKDSGNNVIAGISGVNFLKQGKPNFVPGDYSCPVLFLGAKNAANANGAKSRFYVDGRIVTSRLEATSGCKFGNFTIDTSSGQEGSIFYNRTTTTTIGGEIEFVNNAQWINFGGFLSAKEIVGDEFNKNMFAQIAVESPYVPVQTAIDVDKCYPMIGIKSTYNSWAGLVVDVPDDVPAIEMPSGYFSGFRLRVSYIYINDGTLMSVVLSHLNNIINIRSNGKGAIALWLPNNPKDGQIYKIICIDPVVGSAFTLESNDMQMITLGLTNTPTKKLTFNKGTICINVVYVFPYWVITTEKYTV